MENVIDFKVSHDLIKRLLGGYEMRQFENGKWSDPNIDKLFNYLCHENNQDAKKTQKDVINFNFDF